MKVSQVQHLTRKIKRQNHSQRFQNFMFTFRISGDLTTFIGKHWLRSSHKNSSIIMTTLNFHV